MEIQSAFNSGLQGFQKATEQANKAAENIAANTVVSSTDVSEVESEASASSNQSTIPDLNQSLVDLKVAEHQAKSSARVIESADESLGTLLDVTA